MHMIPEIDNKLTVWGDWVRVERQPSLTSLLGKLMDLGPSGMLSIQSSKASGTADNAVAESVDRYLAIMKSKWPLCYKVIKYKYWFGWPNEQGAKEMHKSLTVYKELLNKAHSWLDGAMTDLAIRN